MARLKFLVFAVIALGLWGYHLAQVSPLAVVSAVEQANASVAGATAPVAVALESRRSLVQATALKVASTAAAAWNPGPKPGAKPEAPTVDRIASVRSAAQDSIPPELKDALFVAVMNDVGSLSVKGTGEPANAAPEGVDFAAITQAGPQGAVLTLDGVAYLGFAVPLAISDKNEVRQGGSAIVALPLLPDVAVLESTRKSLNLQSIGVFAGGKPVLKAGDESSVTGFAALKAGATGNLVQGSVRELGPIALPVMIPETAHQVGTRQAIAGTAFEVVATASSRAALDALAGYQVFAISGLAGLLLLTLVFTIIMGGASEEAGPGMVMPPPMPAPPKREESVKPAFTPPMEDAPLPPQEQQPDEASPDDFDFPPAGSTGQNSALPPPQQNFAPPPPPAQFAEPTSDPFAQAAPPPPPPARPAPPPPPIATSEVAAYQPGGLMDEDEGQRTVAYPAFKNPPAAAAADPFALAAAQEESPAPGFGDDNVDATRVAAVPAELIKAARAGSGATAERPAMKPPAGASMPRVAALPVAGGNDEERHFQEVFRDFVSTREKCREPADGLTFDKFKTKLLKNKEQLVAKYQCRTVRFQVYVKDGKAALKATPVKD